MNSISESWKDKKKNLSLGEVTWKDREKTKKILKKKRGDREKREEGSYSEVERGRELEWGRERG